MNFDPTDSGKFRGLILFELDPITCTTRNRYHFDTYGSDLEIKRLLGTLESATKCTIIVGISADTAETTDFAFRSSVNWFFTKYNMKLDDIGLEYRDKFVFIMQKRYMEKTSYRRKPRYGACLEASFTLSGKL